MPHHLINHADDPKWVEVGHGSKYVSFAVRDFETSKATAVILTAEQALAIGLDLIKSGALLEEALRQQEEAHA